MSRTVSLVGSTGSIGTQAVDVISADPDRFRVIALGAATSIDVLGAQAHRLRPEAVAIADVDLVPKLEELVPPGTEVVGGSEALADVSRDAEVVLNAVVGFAGLP
ncbi:MAG: 1-deoxy-D-xylulose-5-phosphate reductoisomerase, partial [Acidimicrobiia bacterium]|nr:1-deoxy-D-xylulose-5-phosphate reductoisomerase [Acidimicrobiia bacterium]